MIYSGASGTETTYYATPAFEAVVSSAGTDYRHYISAAGRPVVVVSRTTAGAINVHSLLSDQQGSIATIVANATGTSTANESFTPYGTRREAATWSGSPTSTELAAMNGVTREGYTFQTVLGSMGLNHMNGRIEDSVTGRFLSADPLGTISGNTQSWNRYTYVLNNPLSFTDPSGFATTCGGAPGTHREFAIGGQCGGSDGGAASVYNQLEAQEVASNITIPGDASTDALFGSLNWLFGGNTTVCVQNCGMLRGGSIDACDPISGDCTTTTFEPQPDPSAIYVSLQNLNGVPSIGGTGSSAVQSPKSAAQSPQTKCTSSSSWTDYLPHGAGGSVGYNFAAGVSSSWSAAKTGSYGGGQFFSSNTGPNQGTFTTSPGPISSSSAYVASASGGASVFLTNAQSVQQLGGPFTTDSVDVGVGPLQFGAQLSYCDGIWQLSFSPPFAGLTLGLSVSQTTTNTGINSQSSNGCH
jgi:RHS repeat-associated protein